MEVLDVRLREVRMSYLHRPVRAAAIRRAIGGNLFLTELDGWRLRFIKEIPFHFGIPLDRI